MKKKLLAICMAGALVASLAGCGSKGGQAAETTSAAASETTSAAASEATGASASETTAAPGGAAGALNINVILKTTASEYWGYVMAGAQAYAKDHPEVKVDVQGASSETAYDEQLNIIETNMAANKYNGFVIAPLQADMVVTKIAGAKLPIIALDTKIEAPEILSFVGTGNEAAAKEGGKAAVEAAKAAGWTDLNAIAISGVQGDSTATARLAGYKAGVEEAGGKLLENETQYADAVADKAFASMEAIMQNHPEGVAMIVCNNDDMAMAAARAAAGNAAYEKTIFCGFDGIQSACEAILAGEETMSVAQNAYDMGYKAVGACVDAINGKQIESFIDSGSKMVTIDNAKEHLDTLKGQLGQ